MSNDVPITMVGPDDLAEPMMKGDLINCPRPDCDLKHEVQLSKDKDGNETDMLMFVKCGSAAYCVGVGGRRWV